MYCKVGNYLLLLGIARTMIQEELVPVEANTVLAPKMGWALFERPPPSRLNPVARSYLVELFQVGKDDRNKRVSPQEAEKCCLK